MPTNFDAFLQLRLSLSHLTFLIQDKASIETNIIAFADKITQAVDKEGYPSNFGFPNEFSRYPWGSNSFIINRAVVLAYAYEITGKVAYQKYLLRSMDYIMGVNAMGISYVTVRT
jgi:endoglucanase